MRVFHTHDPELINRIVNQDGVREFFHVEGQLVDLTPAVEPPSTQTGVVALTDGEDAVALFAATGPGIYQSHTLFGPTCRGRQAVETGKAMVAYMFDHGAECVWGSTPRDNRKAVWFNHQIGAVPTPASDETEEVFQIVRGRWPAGDSKIIRHTDLPVFFSVMPLSAGFRHFVLTTRPLDDPSRPPEIIVLSNGKGVSGAFAYCAHQVWRMFFEALPGVSEAEFVDASREMIAWMLDHGATSIVSIAASCNKDASRFHKAIGARRLMETNGEDIFEITRRTH